jgi:hypothetical protein
MSWNPRPATVEAFTHGDCWRLAVEVRRLTGLPLIFANPLPEMQSDYWEHVGALLPDDTVVDVNGITSREQWLAKWNSETGIITEDSETISELLSDQETEFPKANPRATARRLLNQFNIPTTGRRHRDALPRN